MAKQKREVGKEGVGSVGDIRDRARDIYKPGARQAPKPGLRNPMDVIRGMRKPKPKKG